MPPKIKLSKKKMRSANDYSAFSTDISKCNGKLFSQDTSSNRLELDTWTLPNNKNFMSFIKGKFNTSTVKNQRVPIKLWKESDSDFIDINPFKHQKFVSDYLSENSPYRGLLLYHGLGSGKSGASVMIGEGFRNKHVVILLPASLRDNYVGELNTFADIAYKKNYHWCFINCPESSPETEAKYLEMFKSKGIDKNIVAKILKVYKRKDGNVRGLWMIDYTKDIPNYNKLNEESQKEVDSQIKIMLDHKYSILHYNAGQYTITKILDRLLPAYKAIKTKLLGDISESRMKESDKDLILNYIYDSSNNVKNPFDDKVLIVDEVHNLTSKMVGAGFNGSRLYELIMRAKNCRIVFLSGTPVINTPFELALLFNMLRGFVYSYRLTLRAIAPQSFNVDRLKEILHKTETIDRFEVDVKSNSIEVTRAPIGFVNKYNESGEKIGVSKNDNNSIDEEEFVNGIFKMLFNNGYQQDGDVVKKVYKMFPGLLKNSLDNNSMRGGDKFVDLEKKNFVEAYVDMSNYKVNNENQFKNRILGLVSFYDEISGIDEETGANLFPDKYIADKDETTVKMSNFQFVEYAYKRRQERELEDKLKYSNRDSDKAGAIDKMPSYFKVFSRQKGTFVFPPHITRPQPIKKDKAIKRKITSVEYYGLSQERMDEIIAELREIFTSEKTDRMTKYTNYMESVDIDSSEHNFIENVIQNMYIGNYSDNDYEEWLKDHDFEEDVFEIPEVSPEEEENYKVQCRKAIEKLEERHLVSGGMGINLNTLSPKYDRMIKNIIKSPGNVFCYSQFRSVEGIEIFSRALSFNGFQRVKLVDIPFDYDTISIGDTVRYEHDEDEWSCYKVLDITSDNSQVQLDGVSDKVAINKVFKCRFALWTGTEDVEERRKIQTLYNSPENRYGQQCLILLTTQSGSEGISLHNVRQVHVMEPYWNNVRIDQVVGRARRIKSHIYLPERHRNVTIFKYIIQFTDEQLEGTWVRAMSKEELISMRDGKDSGFVVEDYEVRTKDEDPDGILEFLKYAKNLSEEIKILDKGLTSDENLDNIARNKEMILSSFLRSIKEASVDCEFNWQDNVRAKDSHSELRCYNIIDTDSNYSYSLMPTSNIETSSTKEHTKTDKYRLITTVVPYKSKRYSIIILIPDSLYEAKNGKVNEILNSLDNGYGEIYDYYLYNNLYYQDTTHYHQFVKIGKINKIGDRVTFDFNASFVEKLDQYRIIEDCIRENPRPSGGVTEQKKIIWAESIRKCHQEKSETTKWECPICSIKYDQSTQKCLTSDCSITIKDVQSFMDATSTVSSRSAKSTSSTTSTKSSVTRVRL